MRKDLLKGFTDEQIAKIKACKNQDELLALAKQEGVELSDEQLEAVNGGGCDEKLKCPKCGYDGQMAELEINGITKIYCGSCGAFIKNG